MGNAKKAIVADRAPAGPQGSPSGLIQHVHTVEAARAVEHLVRVLVVRRIACAWPLDRQIFKLRMQNTSKIPSTTLQRK